VEARLSFGASFATPFVFSDRPLVFDFVPVPLGVTTPEFASDLGVIQHVPYLIARQPRFLRKVVDRRPAGTESRKNSVLIRRQRGRPNGCPPRFFGGAFLEFAEFRDDRKCSFEHVDLAFVVRNSLANDALNTVFRAVGAGTSSMT